MTPLISIIIPAYNTEKYITNCIESCMSQTYNNLEIIIVNDGSSDATLSILRKFELIDDRIVIVDKLNAGLVEARKSGISVAKGEYVFFIDSDDVIRVFAIEKLVLCCIETNSDIVIGNVHIVTPSNRTISVSQNKFSFGTSNIGVLCGYLTKEINPSLCFRLIRTSLLKCIDVNHIFTIGEDFIANVLMLKCEGIAVNIIDDVIYDYIQYDGSMINRQSEIAANARMNYIKWVLEYVSKSFLMKNEEIRDCLDFFLMQEYYAFLRSGGDVKKEDGIKQIMRSHCFNNSWALSRLTIIQKILLLAYIINPYLGKIVREMIVTGRYLVRI